jgi:hypothetical protein
MKRLMILAAAFATPFTLADEPAGKAKSPEAAALQDYLAKSHAKKKWQSGPTVLDTPELQKAYPGRRFVFVYSTTPLPPGANLPDVQRIYREQVADIRANYIALSAAAMKAGDEWKVTPYAKAKDFNQGLIKIAGVEDARLAAAAILSLYPVDQVAPRRVDVKAVTVMKTEKGWTCQAMVPMAFQGTVTFNAQGECEAVSKSYAGPYPP